MNTAAAAFRKSKKTQIEMFVYLKLKKKRLIEGAGVMSFIILRVSGHTKFTFTNKRKKQKTSIFTENFFSLFVGMYSCTNFKISES